MCARGSRDNARSGGALWIDWIDWIAPSGMKLSRWLHDGAGAGALRRPQAGWLVRGTHGGAARGDDAAPGEHHVFSLSNRGRSRRTATDATGTTAAGRPRAAP